MKTKKAISLIVLVITIIVMIILASAVIITLSNTGIIGKAQESVDKTNMAQIKEEAEMIKWDLQLTNSKLTQAELVTKLNEHFEQSTVAGNVITTGKYNITVGEDLTLTVGKHQGSTDPDDPEDPDEPTEESIWEAYNIYDALANISDEVLLDLGFVREYHISPYIKVVSKYKQYTLQEYKDQYLLNTMFQAQVSNFTIDDFVLVVMGATSMEELLYAYEQEVGTTITRDQLVYDVFFGYGDVDTALQAIGYTPSEIEEEYAALEQTEVPTEIANKTYTITYPDGSEETVQGSNLSTYIGRYGITTSGEYEITISDATTEETLTVNMSKVVPATYEDEYYTYTFRFDPTYNTYGYGVSVKDNTLSEYGTILTHVAGLPIISMSDTFNSCTNLTTVPNIPNSVTDMYQTFVYCTNLTTVPNIPTSVTSMDSTFIECTNLTTVPNIPNTVTDMRKTFEGCTNLTTVPNIPSSVTDMSMTFYGCTNLTTVPNIPNTVTDMGWTFMGCDKLEGIIHINSTALTSANSSFANCATKGSGLTVVVPNDTVRQLLIDESNYGSKVTIVKSL